MTKTEQNRVLAWRLKVLREASGIGRPCWTRTSDQRIKSPLLYHLS